MQEIEPMEDYPDAWRSDDSGDLEEEDDELNERKVQKLSKKKREKYKK